MTSERKETDPIIVNVNQTSVNINDRVTEALTLHEVKSLSDTDSDSDSSVSLNSFTESLIHACNACYSCHCARGHPSTWEDYVEEKKKLQLKKKEYPPTLEILLITKNFLNDQRKSVRLPRGIDYEPEKVEYDIFETTTEEGILQNMFSLHSEPTM